MVEEVQAILEKGLAYPSLEGILLSNVLGEDGLKLLEKHIQSASVLVCEYD